MQTNRLLKAAATAIISFTMLSAHPQPDDTRAAIISKDGTVIAQNDGSMRSFLNSCKDGRKSPAHSKELKEHFEDADTKPKRDGSIINAIEDGYTQAEVAKYLKMSRSNVCKIMKSVFSTPDL